VAPDGLKQPEQELSEIPGRLERVKKSGMKKLSRTDGDSRFLPQRQGYVPGYTGTIAVSEDHLIVAQQVDQAGADNELPVPMGESVEQQCCERPGQVSADGAYNRTGRRDPAQHRMRQNLRSAVERAIYAKRKQIVEPQFGNLKKQCGMRRLWLRGLAKTAVEFILADTVLNLLRIWRKVPALVGAVFVRNTTERAPVNI
jgi:hypothetical protein